MLKHYLKIAVRNMWKFRTQSLIGIFGLAFGLACFVPAYYWFRYETTYDGFYPDAALIYRVYAVEKQSGKVNEQVPGILETKLHDRFPATETSTGFTIQYENYSSGETPHIRLRTLYTDSAFFRVFPQVFLCGETRRPLQITRNIVLTETAATRLFGDAEKAIGQQIKSNLFSFPPYTVTAVVKDPPPNTNLSFDVIHFPEIQNQMTEYMPEESQWTYFNKQLYIKLNAQTDAKTLAGHLFDITSQLETNDKIEIRMLPIGEVRHRLNADLPFTLGFIRLFVVAGLLLLFSAFFNFLNLYLGLFRQRIREWRQCMVHGATVWQISFQMIAELSCVFLLSLFFAFFLIHITHPAFSMLTDITVDKSRLFHQYLICGGGVMMLILLAGTFPLWRLSRLAFRDLSKRKATGRPALRRLAVSMQLAVSIVFIVAALVVMMQLRFVNRKDLGLDRQNVIKIDGLTSINRKQRTALIHELASIPQIEICAENDFEPRHEDFFKLTEVEWQGKPLHEKPAFQVVNTDSHFAEIFRVKMKQGKWWDEGERRKIVLNEEAVRMMGLSEPIGAVVRMLPEYVSSDGNTPMNEYEVAGVVNDFHSLSLRSRIEPAIFRESAFGYGGLYIRVVNGGEREVMKRITAMLPEIDITLKDTHLTALDELYNRLTRSEQAGLKIFTVLATVCLLISLTGIYAVASASTQRRRKEIAIRKVVGAEVRDVIRMFLNEYVIQVIFAGVVALPLGYFVMNRWLQGYAYRTNISWWLLEGVITGVVALVLLTVLGQVLKAAGSNPADVVKNE